MRIDIHSHTTPAKYIEAMRRVEHELRLKEMAAEGVDVIVESLLLDRH